MSNDDKAFPLGVCARPLKDAPIIHESPEAVLDYYRRSAAFFSVNEYPPDTIVHDKEAGAYCIVQGNEIYPVVRVCYAILTKEALPQITGPLSK